MESPKHPDWQPDDQDDTSWNGWDKPTPLPPVPAFYQNGKSNFTESQPGLTQGDEAPGSPEQDTSTASTPSEPWFFTPAEPSERIESPHQSWSSFTVPDNDRPSEEADAFWRLNDDEAEALSPELPQWRQTEWHIASQTTDGPLFDIAAPFPSAPPIEEGAHQTFRWTSLLREIVETLVLTFLIFVLIRSLVQNFRIEGYSMEPNLHQGQYLIVNKFLYYFQPPQRGDIIVFEYPRSVDRDFIKRVMGVPGDTVEVRPGQIFINGEQIDEPYGPEQPGYSFGPITLKADEYFVLGDNRNNSSDSHTWGPLERKYIIGKAWISYWPPKSWGPVPNYPLQAHSPTP